MNQPRSFLMTTLIAAVLVGVVVGGCGSRHPQIARTVAECTDVTGVLQILEKALRLYKEAPLLGRELSFHNLIKQYGVEGLRV